LGWLYECRSAVFVIVLWMCTSRKSKLTVNFFAPSVEKWFNFYLKNAKNYVFRMRPLLGKNGKFELLGCLYECRGAVFVTILWMWTSKQSRLTIIFSPCVEKWFNSYLKNAKNYVFRMRPFLGKNSKFELLGWLNECRGVVFVIILWMWTSRQSKLTINFFAPSVGKWFNFEKPLKITFFA